MKNTQIKYIYRDSDNKVTRFDSVVLEGQLTSMQIGYLFHSFGKVPNVHFGFIPHWLGFKDNCEHLIALINEGKKVTHLFHELSGLELTDREPTVNMTAEAFLTKMKHIEWREPDIESLKYVASCKSCGGDGIHTCNSSYHGLMLTTGGEDSNRTGCPDCTNKVSRKTPGKRCAECDGKGVVKK